MSYARDMLDLVGNVGSFLTTIASLTITFYEHADSGTHVYIQVKLVIVVCRAFLVFFFRLFSFVPHFTDISDIQ